MILFKIKIQRGLSVQRRWVGDGGVRVVVSGVIIVVVVVVVIIVVDVACHAFRHRRRMSFIIAHSRLRRREEQVFPLARLKVEHFVFARIAHLHKPSAAHTTFERFFTRVSSDVQRQIVPLPALFIAVRALVISGIGMDDHVCVVRSLGLE